MPPTPSLPPQSLRDRLAAQIAVAGPMTVAQYMTACLHDPRGGYYATRPAIAEAGDFITAPMVSQMFGELIGLWAAAVWEALGRPPRVILAELGPGDGTLMADALRAARAMPGFSTAAEVWLVEVSPPLREAQAARFAGHLPRWAERIDDLPDDAPLILIANEVLDCLPARQFVATGEGWCERMVGIDGAGALTWGLRPAGDGFADLPPPSVDAEIVERSPAQEALGAEIGARLARQTGAALLIDYGRDAPGGAGGTLQALQRHAKVDPLVSPGEADLTVWADFPAVLAAAAAEGATAAPLLTQAEFLARLGVAERAGALVRARPDQAGRIERQLARLTDPDQMGTLFKAACVFAPATLSIPAFTHE